MIKTASKMATALTAATMLSTSAFAADAIVGQDTAPAPESFNESRFYVSAFAGIVFQDDIDLTGNVITPAAPLGSPQSVNVDFDTGYTIGGAIGHNYGDIGNGLSLRAEIELSYSESDVDSIAFSGNGPASENNVDGEFSTTNLLVNGLIDLPKFGDGLITPYVGGGIGIAFSDIDAVYGAAAPVINLDSSEENFIAQAIVGASIAASENTDIFIEGRYSRIFDFETPRTSPAGFTGLVEDDIDTYSINAGFRFKL